MLKNLTTIAVWVVAGPSAAVKTRSLLNNFQREFAPKKPANAAPLADNEVEMYDLNGNRFIVRVD